MAWVIKSPADYAAAMKGIQDKLDRIVENVETASTQAVTDIAIDCIGRAVERAPVETGDLRGSGFAEVNGATVAMGNEDGSAGIQILGSPGEPAGNVVKAGIGFTSPYAFVQHEHMEFNHSLGGQAKYLESVVAENKDKWAEHLAKTISNGLKE
jgi:hypothetical protein